MAHGLFVDGVWQSQWYDTTATGGHFVPTEPVFRNWVTPDGSAGPSGEGGFAAERGRYHLYVSLACPYAHRARAGPPCSIPFSRLIACFERPALSFSRSRRCLGG